MGERLVMSPRSTSIPFRLAALALGLLAAPLCFGACTSTAPPEMRLRVFSPLVAAESGPSTDVSIDGTGCVTVRYPDFDRRHGTQRFQLAGDALAALRARFAAAELARFDARLVKLAMQREKAAASTGTQFLSSDADVIVVEWTSPGKGQPTSSVVVQWVGLEEDLRNHPQLTELQQLGEIKAAMIGLTDSRSYPEARP
jgi:hypothetical protein